MPDPSQDAQPSPFAGLSRTHDRSALARIELFLGTAVATVLVVRSALAVSGYPQVGGGGLHVAHVLWGGLLMGVAIVLVQIVPGVRARAQAAFIGGIGFGLFIDEVGKFLTKDVNYFFRPAVAIIYIVIVGFYLVSRELLTHRPLSEARRIAIAAEAVSDMAQGRLDSVGRGRALALLEGISETPATTAIRGALSDASYDVAPRRLTAARARAYGLARSLVTHRLFHPALQVLIALQLVGLLAQLLLVVLRPDVGLTGVGSRVTDRGAEASTALAVALAAVAWWRLRRGYTDGAVRMLYRSALVGLLFIQVFVFVRYEWSGLLGFAGQTLILSGLSVAAHAHGDEPRT